MQGIDVSNWDYPQTLPLECIDFVIAKCTEGTYFVDDSCPSFIDSAQHAGKLTGLYHFAAYQNAYQEAEYFYKKFKLYNNCVPFLDFELFNLSYEDIRFWCEQFIERFHELSGLYCGLYISASLCGAFFNSWIPGTCELWVAGYPTDATLYEFESIDNMPYNIAPFENAFIWQFSSTLQIGERMYDANCGDFSVEDWEVLTSKDYDSSHYLTPSDHKEEYLLEACRVVLGCYGIGEERRQGLRQNGFNPDVVQAYVNNIMSIIGE